MSNRNRSGKRRKATPSRRAAKPSAYQPLLETLEPRVLLDGSGLSLQLPEYATEGDGVLAGQGVVTIDAPQAEDVTVTLASDDTTEVVVPESVVIQAGQTSATFDLSIQDDTDVDFTQFVDIQATATRFDSTAVTMSVHDNDENGELIYVNNFSTVSYPIERIFSPDGKHVYISSAENSITVFSYDLYTGDAISYVETIQDGVDGIYGLDNPVKMYFSPDGKNLYVASSDDGGITVFERDTFTGKLTLVQCMTSGKDKIADLEKIDNILVSPNGQYVYATGDNSYSIVILKRNIDSGELSFVESCEIPLHIYNSSFEEADKLLLSPDGRHLYVTGAENDTISIFECNTSTGKLKYIQQLRDNSNGIDGLDGISGIVMSPDGSYVYVAGYQDDALVVFERNQETGLLTFRKKQGCSSPTSLVISPDGRYVFCSMDGGRVRVCVRNVDTGYLGYSITSSCGINKKFSSVCVSPNGRFIYADLYHESVTYKYAFAQLGTITLTANNYNLSENDGVLESKGSVSLNHICVDDEIVNLNSSNPGVLEVPETVTIPAGQNFVRFDYNIIDNSLLDMNKDIIITATKEGYVSDSEEVTIHDDETAMLSISLPESAYKTDGVLEGQGTVIIDRVSSVDIVVTLNLSSYYTSVLDIPSYVIIPAGETSEIFDIYVKNNSYGISWVSISAEVEGWDAAYAGMHIYNKEELSIDLLQQVSEGDGNIVGAGTVAISLMPSTDVVVSLVSNDTSEVVVPETVVIPAGQTSATFDVTIVDDAELDGTKFATIIASADGVDSVKETVQVNDDEIVTLTVTIPASANETDGVLAGQGVVNIEQAPAGDLVINLTSSDTTEVVVPETVIIQAGQSSVTFDLDIQQDNIWDSTQQVTITAHVDNWTDGTATIDVVDTNPPVVTLTLPTEATENDGVMQNQGQVTILQPLGNDLVLDISSSNTDLLTVPETVTIVAGQTTATFNITLINDWEENDDATVAVTVIDSTGLVTDQADVLVLDVESLMDAYLIHPSVYTVGNYWSYDLFFTQVNGSDVTSYNVHGSLYEKVTGNVVYDGQAAFTLYQKTSALGTTSTYTETRSFTDGYVQLLQNKSSSGTEVYSNPSELYWLGIPSSSSGTLGDGGTYSGNHTVTKTYTSYGWQTVTVGAGTFNCYKITISTTDIAPGETTQYTKETLYFNPYVGIVKNEIYWREGSGNSESMRITQTLKKTNLSVPGDLTAEVLAPQNADNLVSGDTVRVPILVTNVGDSTISGKMNIEVYVKTVGEELASTDTPSVVLENVKVSLKAGKSATYYANIEIPLNVEGDYYCIVNIDSENAIVETNESNNTAVLADPLGVALGYTDLVGRLSRVNLPDAAVAGQRMRGYVQVQVLNVGNVRLDAKARVNIDVVAVNTETNEVITLGQLKNASVAKLRDNGQQVKTFTVRVNLPEGLPKGEYEIQAVITPNDQVGETNLANNQAIGLLGGDAVNTTSADPFVDLVAGVNDKLAARYALPQATVSGNGQRLYVPITITNEGNVRVARGQRIDMNIYARNDEGEKILIGTLQRISVSNLAPGKTKSILAKATLPPGLATDEYTIVAEIDAGNAVVESDETNNTAVLPTKMNVEEGFVDIVGEFTRVTLPANVVAGQRLRGLVRVKIANNGNVAINTRTRANITLVAVNQETGEEIVLRTLANQNLYKLASDGARPRQFNIGVNLAAGLPEGQYELRADITTTNDLPEADLTNNLVAADTNGLAVTVNSAEAFTDLTPEIVKVVAPKEAQAGHRVVVVARLLNNGNVLCNGWVNLKIEAVGDDQAQTIYTKINQRVKLASGRGQNVTVRFNLPDGLAAGEYSLRLTVESAAGINEGGTLGETNNTAIMANALNCAAPNGVNNEEWLQYIQTQEEYCLSRLVTASDEMGNTYLAGSFGDYADFENVKQSFIQKFSSSGTLLWTRQLGANQCIKIYAIGVDAQNNVYISGSTKEDLAGTNQGDEDVFLRKYNASGNVLWTRQIGSAEYDRCFGMTVDAAGNAYLTGITKGNLFGANSGQADAFIVKYNSSGKCIWSKMLGTQDYEWARVISHDGQGNLYISGFTTENLGSENKIFLAKYSQTGQFLWSKQLDEVEVGPGGTFTVSMNGEGNGNVYFVSNSNSIVVYDSEGNWDSSYQLDDMGIESVSWITISSEGVIYATGWGYVENNLPSAVVSAFTATGTYLWTKAIDTSSELESKGFWISQDCFGNLYVPGQRYENDYNDYWGYLQSDFFLAKLNTTPPDGATELNGTETAPDLMVNIGDPADGKPDAFGWARIDVRNEGTALADGKVDIELWCTSDGTIDGSAEDTLLVTLTEQDLLLLPGETQYVWANYTLPNGINPADVELIALVDTGNDIPESNEDNNYGIVDVVDLSYLASIWSATGSSA